MRCAETSAGEPLAATATVATRFLAVEHRDRWGREPLDDETALPAPVREAGQAFDGRVLLIRRPDRREGPTAAFVADVEEGGGTLRAAAASGLAGEPVAGPLFLVCTHGRRDRCCAQRGVPLYDALAPHIDDGLLWQSSHHGGHRFAANLLVLPAGIQLGRVGPAEAARVAATLAEGRIPLEHYRGRTLHSPRMQAADAAVRSHFRLERIVDVRPLSDDGEVVEVATPEVVVRVRVDERDGPVLPPSCGAEPEPTRHLVARIG